MEPMPPRRMLRTNRFRANRTGSLEEEKKVVVVTPVIRFKVKGGGVPDEDLPNEFLRSVRPSRTIRSVRGVPSRRRRPRRLISRRRRAPRRRVHIRRRRYGAPKPEVPAKNSIEAIAEDFLDKSGLAFPCGLRKSGKTSLGKKPRPPQRKRRPWQVKLAQSSQIKKFKHKRNWKRRGQDIDFGL